MGSAIAELARRSGHTMDVLDSSDGDKPVTGDIVVLAVPYPAVGEIISARRDQLSGKVVVDITHPLNFKTFDSLTVAADESAAAELADALQLARSRGCVHPRRERPASTRRGMLPAWWSRVCSSAIPASANHEGASLSATR